MRSSTARSASSCTSRNGCAAKAPPARSWSRTAAPHAPTSCAGTLAGLGIPHRTLAPEDGGPPTVRLADGQVLTDPKRRRADAGARLPDRARPARGRPRRRRRRSRRAERGGVRRLGGPADDGARRRRRRRPSRLELADPQLPRLSSRARRRRAGAARLSAGLALRRRSSGSPTAPSHSSRATAGTSFAPPEAPRSTRARRARARGRVPPARRARPDRARGAGVFYGASVSEAQALAGEYVYVVGGGNSAGQAALHFAATPAGSGSSSAAKDSRRRCRGT